MDITGAPDAALALWPMESLAAAHAAVANLESDDKYGVPLRAWLAGLDAKAEDERPLRPPKLDTRRLSAELRELREAAREAATAHWDALHAAWELSNDERKAQHQADYDATRDWAHERANRAKRAEDAEWRADLKEMCRPARERKVAAEQARQKRRVADEQLVEQHMRVRAPQPVREDIRQRRERQWAVRRWPAPLESSSDSFEASDSDDPFAEGSVEQRAERRRERRRLRHMARQKHQPSPPQPSAEEVVGEVVSTLIEQLEREQRKAEVITDGHTLYDDEFYLIDPKTRRHDDERGAFVAYPDGSRCWVHRPFRMAYDPNGGNAPPSLVHVKQPCLLVMPWTIERGFCEPQSVDGVSSAQVAEVCVLLRSLSKLLTLRGNSRGSNSYALPADAWVKANLEVKRCSEHDWCQIEQVPCTTDSPERVLVAVLEHYDCWSLSWLAKRWRQCRHTDGIGAFICDGKLIAPIRKPPAIVPPTRSLTDLTSPGLVKHCRHSTRELRPGEVVTCGAIRMPPPLVQMPLILRVGENWSQRLLDIKIRRDHDSDLMEWKWQRCCPWSEKEASSVTSDSPHVSTCLVLSSRLGMNPNNPISWKARPICVCDASPDELQMVLCATRDYKSLCAKVWAQEQEQREAEKKAAEMRRRNARLKRKRAESDQEESCAESDPEAAFDRDRD